MDDYFAGTAPPLNQPPSAATPYEAAPFPPAASPHAPGPHPAAAPPYAPPMPPGWNPQWPPPAAPGWNPQWAPRSGGSGLWVKVLIGVAGGIAALVVLAILAAIAIPVFLN